MPKNVSKSTSANKSDQPIPFVVTHKLLVITVFSAALFIFSGMMWWKNIYNNPHRVFEAMLRNNLSTQSVTRQSFDNNLGVTIDKTEQLSFVPKYASRVLMKQSQGETGEDKVTQEQIGTLDQNFTRFVTISTSQKNQEGKTLDYKSIEGVWGYSDPKIDQTKYFSQSAQGLVLFANFDASSRKQILDIYSRTNTYQVDYANVKPKRIDGKSALVYPVKINLSGYVEALIKFSKIAGLEEIPGLEPSQYAGQPPIEVTITVDKLSRQILELVNSDNQKETYSSYGLSLPIDVPTNSITVEELRNKIQEIK